MFSNRFSLSVNFHVVHNFHEIAHIVLYFIAMKCCGLLQHEDSKEKKQESQKFHFDAM